MPNKVIVPMLKYEYYNRALPFKIYYVNEENF